MAENFEGDSNTDARWFGLGKKPKPGIESFPNDYSTNEELIPVIDKQAEFYNIGNIQRGVALIFNHYQFDDKENTKREGTEKDCNDLEKLLIGLNFDVTVYNDLKYGQLFDILEKVAKQDHSNSDCLFIAVMSHGDKDKIYARDHHYSPDTLWMNFTGSRCETLVGKPKFFFIQACRGNKLDAGIRVRGTVVKDSASTYKIPNMADILVMYSTYEDHYSFRSSIDGSWFIQCLVKELLAGAKTDDMLGILTRVNRRMAFEFESFVPGNRDFHEQKQIGTIVSTLTKKFRFYEF